MPLYYAAAAWAIINFEIILVVLAIAAVIAILYVVARNAEAVFSFIGGLIGAYLSLWYDLYAAIYNVVMWAAEIITATFLAAKRFLDLILMGIGEGLLGMVKLVIDGVQGLVNGGIVRVTKFRK